ncbi:MAG: hypothetical protein KDJ97_15225, partial [Anaerolineae bacterium]|nr:hypothetical protein [Anaerolineae bacterium]
VLAQGRFDPLTDGLVGWWQLDESAWTQDCITTDITDSSGNRNHGKSCPGVTGPAGGVAGRFNNGADLDGNDDYLLINAHSSLDLVNN